MGNTFGRYFRVTTWGESHGPAIGAVIDGCPSGLPLTELDIQIELDRRKPGGAHTTPRQEKDRVKILSGVFEGKTTGTPLSLLIENHDADATSYEPIKDLVRPGHANATYLAKYGIFDYRGGGRASARETATRVAAGAVAKKLLQHWAITLAAELVQAGGSHDVLAAIDMAQKEGDSIGGLIRLTTSSLPRGLGCPVFDKLEAEIGKAILSIPACKGIAFGAGFSSCHMKGSSHNDLLDSDGKYTSNHAGGVLGGLSTGMPLVFEAAFKPTSSIRKPQETITTTGEKALFELPPGSRHDPCVALRAVPVVEAMTALVLLDALLQNRLAKI